MTSGTTDEHARWKGLEIRRPDDVRTSPGGPVPLRWQVDKHGDHVERLGNNILPADFEYDVERGDGGDALAALALGESMRRDIAYQRGNRIHEALMLGSTWRQIATALDVTADDARGLLRAYADGQRHLYRGDVEAGRERRLGFSNDKHAAVIALCDRADDGEDSPVGA